MRKNFSKLFVLVLVIFMMIPLNIVFANSKIDLIVEGQIIKLDQAPVMENGRVLVPLRGFFEALEAEMEWDGSTNTIIGKKENTIVKLQIGSKVAYVNHKEMKLNVQGKLIEGRTIVPVKFVAESLGVKVDWDVDTQRVVVGKGLETISEIKPIITDSQDLIHEQNEASLAEQAIYENIIALEEQYPEGMPWTNDNYYSWNGGIFSGGYGCAEFAFLLSDEVFGSLNARKHNDFSNLRVGDIVRINNDTHYVIILSIHDVKITVAEGNYNKSVHWGRTFSLEEIKSEGDYILTRYPK